MSDAAFAARPGYKAMVMAAIDQALDSVRPETPGEQTVLLGVLADMVGASIACIMAVGSDIAHRDPTLQDPEAANAELRTDMMRRLAERIAKVANATDPIAARIIADLRRSL